MSQLQQVCTAVLILGFTTMANAATITWGSAQNTTSTSDVVLTGVSYHAINEGEENSRFPNGTGNGEGFTGSVPEEGSLGGNASGMVAGTTGSAAFDALLDNLTFGGGNPTTVDLGDFNAGHQYQVQVFWTDMRGANRLQTFGSQDSGGVAASTVVLGSNPGGGAFGQFAVGTFTADGDNPDLRLSGLGNGHINAWQIRDLTNLVRNGSFEIRNNNQPNTTHDDSVNGWTEIGAATAVSIQNSAAASDNDNLAQIGRGGTSGGTIHQDIDTIAGRTYRLTFDFGKLGNQAGTVDLSIDVTDGTGIAGTSLLGESIASTNNASLDGFIYEFTALSSITNLAFTDATVGGSSRDGRLDNVIVTLLPTVPEPSTFVLLLAGIGSLVGTRGRRRIDS